MNKRILITKVYNRNAAFFQEDGTVTRIRVIPKSNGFSVGTVVLSRVKKLIESTGACFVDIGDDRDYFLQLPKDISLLTFGDGKEHKSIKCEDMILVQVSGEAVKKKAPTVSYAISLSSEYFVICPGHGISYSSKTDEAARESITLPSKVHELSSKYHIIIRTALVPGIDTELLKDDIEALAAKYEHVFEKAAISPVKTVICQNDSDLLGINEWFKYGPDEIVTDLPEFKDNAEDLAHKYGTALRFYEDDLLPMCKLYKLETVIDTSLAKQVYLKSGGFIIIEQCETLCAIDVNSGHNIKGDKEEKSFEINVEACMEIARQLKVRNISGMVVIDFINMKKKAHVDELIRTIKDVIKTDDVPVRFVDMTGLGLIELTRKKILMSLAEQWKISD